MSYPIVKPILSHLCTMIKFNNYHLATFGVESVAVTDTTGGRVCLECSFSSFSTDTGCIVELVSSGSVQYIETITRSSNSTAEGCVSDVTEGVYDVKVYDQSSSELVNETTDVTVLLLLSTTTTNTNNMLHSSTVSTVALTTNESQSEHMGYINVVLMFLYIL